MSGKQISIFVLILTLFCGCGGQGPQRPSQRKGEKPKEDTAQLALMEMTLCMAEAADKAVEQAVQAQEEPFALYEAHAWVHLSDPGRTEEPTLQPQKPYTIHMRVYSLDGKLLEDTRLFAGRKTAGGHERDIHARQERTATRRRSEPTGDAPGRQNADVRTLVHRLWTTGDGACAAF